MSASEDVFDRIRGAAAEVAQQAKFVRLVDAQIAPYAASLAAERLPTPVYDTDAPRARLRGRDSSPSCSRSTR